MPLRPWPSGYQEHQPEREEGLLRNVHHGVIIYRIMGMKSMSHAMQVCTCPALVSATRAPKALAT